MAQSGAIDVGGAFNAHDPYAQASQGNEWELWFGPNKKLDNDTTSRAYDKLNRASETLPDVYKGDNYYLRDTVDGFMLDQEEFYTTNALTWAHTDKHHFTWTTYHFNVEQLERVPETGIPRLMTHRTSQGEAHMVRRGIAWGFMKTPQGQEQYWRNIVGIQQSLNETVAGDVMMTLKSSHQYEKKYMREQGMMNQPISVLMREEMKHWCNTQKTDKGLEFAIARAQERHKKMGGQLDMAIFPPNMQIYLKEVRPEDTYYYMAGPGGRPVLRSGARTLTTFMNLRVFETRLLDVYSDADTINPLLDEKQIGSYYVMQDHAASSDHTHHLTAHRRIYIYDIEQDAFVPIELDQALRACQRFNPNGGDLNDKYHKEAREKDEQSFEGTSYDPFFYSAMEGSNSVLKLVQFFGDLEKSVGMHDTVNARQTGYADKMSDRTFKNVVDSICGAVIRDSGDSELMKKYQEALNFIVEMENRPYDPDEVDALLAYWQSDLTNIQNGVYNGGLPAPKIPDQVKGSPDAAWTPNCMFANWPALLNLSQSSASGAAWMRKTQQRASSAVESIRTVMSQMQKIFPQSYAFDAAAASPWWITDDVQLLSEIAFFEQCVSVARHPFTIKGANSTAAPPSGTRAGKVFTEKARQMQYDLTSKKDFPPPQKMWYQSEKEKQPANPPPYSRALEQPNYYNLISEGQGQSAEQFVDELQQDADLNKEASIADVATWASNHLMTVGVPRSVIDSSTGYESLLENEHSHEEFIVGAASEDGNTRHQTLRKFVDLVQQDLVDEVDKIPVGAMSIMKNGDTSGGSVNLRPGGWDGIFFPGTVTLRFAKASANKIYVVTGLDVNDKGITKLTTLSEDLKKELPDISILRRRDFQNLKKELAWEQRFSNLVTIKQDGASAEQGVFATWLHLYAQESPPMQYWFKTLEKGTLKSPLAYAAGRAFVTAPCNNEDYWRYLCENNVLMPLSFLLARPYQTYETYSVILMRGGYTTGATFYGESTFTLSDDGLQRTHVGNYSIYVKATVIEEKHVIVQPDILSVRYVRGENISFFEYHDELHNNVAPYKSIFSLACSADGLRYIPNNLDVRGRYEVDSWNPRFDLDNQWNLYQHYPSATYYNLFWEWSKVCGPQQIVGYTPEQESYNAICVKGAQWNVNPATNEPTTRVLEKGHWGITGVGPNAEFIRNGGDGYFETLHGVIDAPPS